MHAPTDRRPARVTRADVAREAGTSVAVVSYVVNDGPRPVAEATRLRVLAAIERTGYRPDNAARALAGGATMTLGVILPDIANEFFAELAQALEREGRAAGRALLLGDTGNDPAAERELLQRFVERRIDGVAIAAADPEAAHELLTAARIPTVFFGAHPQDPCAAIGVDNTGGSRDAVAHLMGHGHTRVAVLAGPEGDRVAGERLLGCRQAAGSGLGPVVHAPFTVEDGYRAAGELLDRSPRPRAVFASSDRQAIGLLRAAADRGLGVPTDLAVAAFDGSAASRYSIPSLTSATQPVADMAALAVRTLLDPTPTPRAERILDVHLVVRRSCGCDRDGPVPTPPTT